jgi:hypothetical protein
MLVWALVMIGFTTIVTQSKLFGPLRIKWVRWTSRVELSPSEGRLRVPTLWSTFFQCPLCVGFWAGFLASAVWRWGIAPTFPYSVVFQWVANGLASSATCWISYVFLHSLGAGKL